MNSGILRNTKESAGESADKIPQGITPGGQSPTYIISVYIYIYVYICVYMCVYILCVCIYYIYIYIIYIYIMCIYITGVNPTYITWL